MKTIDTSEMTSAEIDALCAKLRKEKMLLKQIAEMLGVSKERVRQRVCKHERLLRKNSPRNKDLMQWIRLHNSAPTTKELHYLLVLLPFLRELAQWK